jgi:EAL and modified HD-GYP domain-containing signal transduction protein
MSEYFIGRQPIFDNNMDVYAYELLFRNGNDNSANFVNGEEATSQVIGNSLAEVGLENLVGRHYAFINLTSYFVAHPELIIYSPSEVVLELLEDIEVDDELLANVQLLKDRGYTIALDDFIHRPDLEPLVDLADLIKIDITQLDDQELCDTVAPLKAQGKTLLAEKIETVEEFEKLRPMGFDLYQGYFFARPKIISGRKLPGNKMALIELAAKIHHPDIDMDELNERVSQDVSLSVKTLRYVNSPANGLRAPAETIRQAISLLGISKLKNWVTILSMAAVDDKPSELIKLALLRARMCELLAQSAKLAQRDAFFTVGMFSVLDALLDSDMKTVLDSLPLQIGMRDALIDHSGPQGEALVCVRKLETGDALPNEFFSTGFDQINDLYLQAMQFANKSAVNLN